MKYSSTEKVRQLISIWQHSESDTIKKYSNFPIQIFNRIINLSMILEMQSFADNNHQQLIQLLGAYHKDTLGLEYCGPCFRREWRNCVNTKLR